WRQELAGELAVQGEVAAGELRGCVRDGAQPVEDGGRNRDVPGSDAQLVGDHVLQLLEAGGLRAGEEERLAGRFGPLAQEQEPVHHILYVDHADWPLRAAHGKLPTARDDLEEREVLTVSGAEGPRGPRDRDLQATLVAQGDALGLRLARAVPLERRERI